MSISVYDLLKNADLDDNVITVVLIDSANENEIFSGSRYELLESVSGLITRRKVVEWSIPYGDKVEVRFK